MRIVIASTIVPFIQGGGTFIVDWLEIKLREYGHTVDVVNIPFSSDYTRYLEQCIALRLYHLEDSCDRLICIRMPSYLLKHPEKYLWFIHHYREAYDLWGTEYQSVPNTPEGYALREYIMRADELAFSEAKKIYTNSKIVSKRLKDFNGVDSEVVYPPLLNPDQFYCSGYGDYIYYSSRICRPKRQLLAVEAMKYTKTDVRLIISGRIEQLSLKNEIYSIIRKNNLEKKVVIDDRWISEKEKADYFAGCLCGLYIPFDEDSYGYTSLESHHSQKGVITCTDSGGTGELIIDGYNGLIVPPDPRELARQFDMLYEDRTLAENLGINGKKRIEDLQINWYNVIRRFTE